MEFPFFRNDRWYQNPTRPKVVQIPVQFVGSNKPDRCSSATKIQKVFRGFVVRKCLKKIKDIKFEVDEVEERLLDSRVVELVRRDERERLRMNERLMSLLFKLDSICGVDFGVRVCRKAVIRKAIALQERIDAIVAVGFDGDVEAVDREDEVAESKDLFEIEGNNGEIDVIGVDFDRNGETLDRDEEKVSSNQVVKLKDSFESGGDLERGSIDEVEGDKQGKAKEVDGENKRNRELMERMMEDSEKMMILMTQLFERNEMQTKMLNALTNRVEMLERAFVCDVRLRKKKKQKKKANAACRD